MKGFKMDNIRTEIEPSTKASVPKNSILDWINSKYKIVQNRL